MTGSAARSFAELLAARAAPLGRRIAFPEAADPRVRAAATLLEQRGTVQPVLLGAADEEDDRPAPGPDDAAGAALATAMRMLAEGAVDGVVAGAVHPTASVVRAALRQVGLREGVRTLSSCFLLDVPGFRAHAREGRSGPSDPRAPASLRPHACEERSGPSDPRAPAGLHARCNEVLTFADPAVVPDPRPRQLAEIASEAVRLRRLVVGDDPVVAFLSYSTRGSAAGPSVDKVRKAAALFRDAHPDVPSGGEMQADVALAPAVARSKWPGSTAGGRANVLVFPSLDAANIAYKLVQRLAGAAAFGPILQGLAAPANDLSRGASAADIVAVAAVTALMAGDRPSQAAVAAPPSPR